MAGLFDSFKDMAKTAQGAHIKQKESYPGIDEAEPAYVSGAVTHMPTQGTPEILEKADIYSGARRPVNMHYNGVQTVKSGVDKQVTIEIVQKLVTYDPVIGGIQKPAIAYLCRISGETPIYAMRTFYGLMPDTAGTRTFKLVGSPIQFDVRTNAPVIITYEELRFALKRLVDKPNAINALGASISSDGKGGIRVYDVKSMPVGVADKVPYGGQLLTKLKPEFSEVSNVLGFVDTFKYPAMY